MDKLIELAISYGRKKQSPRTGFVHYCYETPLEDHQDTIPVVKNMLFALALLRSREGDNIHEAKNIIEKLLHFQGPSGNFPVYLHEYPNCRYSWLPIELLPPCYWIIKEFDKILGKKLLDNFLSCIDLVLEYCLKEYQRSSLGPLATLKLGLSCIALGKKDFGEKILPDLQDSPSMFTPKELGEILVAHQMVKPLEIWDHLKAVSHWHSGVYVGSAIREYYSKGRPNLSLYDFYMAALTKRYPEHIFAENPFQLRAVLIRPIDYDFVPRPLPFEENGIYQTEEYAYSLIEKNTTEKDSYHKAFHPLKIVFDDITSMVCHSFGIVNYNSNKENIELIFTLPEKPPVYEIEKEREICFCVNKTEIKINDTPATIFHLGDKIDVILKKYRIIMIFEMVSGEGTFCGHIMNGKRSSELLEKGNDKQIFLRTVDRKGPCQIKAKINIIRK